MNHVPRIRVERFSLGRQLIELLAAAVLFALLASVFLVARPARADEPNYLPAPDPQGLPAASEEQPELRTRSSRTYGTPAGDDVAVISSDAINYRDDDGLFQPIDNTLVEATGGGYENQANAYHLQLPASLSDEVQISRGDYTLGFALQGAGGSASVEGARASYADAFPGVSVAYTAESADVKETLTLASAAAPHSFVYSLAPGPGLSVSEDDSGMIDIRDSDGTRQFAFAPAFMRDAAGETHAVDYSLQGNLLTMNASADWLADPARQYPVVIDPTIPSLAPIRDCMIQSGTAANTNYCSATTLGVGKGVLLQRSLLSFDLSSIPRDVQVLSARLNLYLASETSTSAAPIELHRLTQPFTSAVTWNKKDGVVAWTTPGADFDPVAAATTTVGGTVGTTISWYPTTMVQNWVSGLTTNNGLLVKQASETVSNTLTFNANEATGNRPQLTVWYEPWVGDSPQWTYVRQQLTQQLSTAVNVANGNVLLREDNFSLAGKAGFDFAFTSWHNSRANRTGFAGTQWEDTLTAAVKNVFGDGSVELYLPSGTDVVFKPDGNGGYLSPPEAHARLVRNVDSSYTLTYDADGHKLNFSAAGALTSMKDRNGNTISISGGSTPQSVTDTANRTTTLTSTNGNLTQISDPASRTYGFTRASGDNKLVSDYTDPLNKTTHFDYAAGTGRITKITDPLGKITELGYEAASPNRVTSLKRVTDTVHDTGPTWSFAYATSDPSCPSGTFAVTSVTDPNNHTTKYCSDSQARVIKTIDPLGNANSVDYTSAHGGSGCAGDTYCSATDALGNTTTYAYNANNRLLWSQSPLEDATHRPTFAYGDANHPYLPSSFTDARGKVTSYSYDPVGNTTQVVLDGTTTEQNVYDSAGQLTSSTDGRGKTSTVSYDSSGNVTSQTNPAGDKATYTYDTVGRELTRVDPLGNVTGGNPAAHTTSFTYDADDRVLTNTDPLGYTTTYTYTADGDISTLTDAANHTTTYAYDALNLTVSDTSPDPDGAGPLTAPVTSYGYDAAGNLVSEVDPRGNVPGGNPAAYTTTYGYDANDQLTSETTPLGERTTYAYDANGNLASTVDPRGNVQGNQPSDYTTSYTYDAVGQRLTAAAPLSHTMTYSYDLAGNAASVTDANNHTTSYAYDAAGRVLSETAPDGGVTTYTYDGAGNKLSARDADNHATTFTYDNAGRLASRTSPLGHKWTYSYDANANLITTINPQGNATGSGGATSYGYDADNRVGTISYSDSTPTVTLNYNAVGQRTAMTDGSGTVTYSYDELGRLTNLTRGADQFSYSYDPSDNITSRTYPGGTIISATYDADNQLASVTGDSGTTTYAYDAAGNLTQRNLLPNNYVETRTYDRSGELTDVKNALAGNVASEFAYTRDAGGNPTQVVQTGAVSSTTTYGYDPNNRLTSVCYQASCPGQSDPFVRWTYDGAGNRLTEARPSGTTTYSYDMDDELTSAGSTSYSYDANGNEIAAGSRTFGYDLANRLSSTTSGGTTTTYAYDGDGNRLQASTGGGGTTNYLWDVNGDLPKLALERDGNGGVLRRYVYGMHRISMASGGSVYYYLYDGLGSVVNLTSTTGTTEWTYAYEPFGAFRSQVMNDPQAPTNVIGFAGELLDPSGLYYLRARQYDPQTGMFLRPDPASAVGGGIAAYSYAGARPTVLTDPAGMNATDATEADRFWRGYVNPFYRMNPRNLQLWRTDMGVDYAAQSGAISAIGRATIHGEFDDPSWYGHYLSYRLRRGFLANRYVYVAEHINDKVSCCRTVARGAVIATFSGGGIEIGWSSSNHQNTWFRQYCGHYDDNWNWTGAGRTFARLLRRLGARTRDNPGPGRTYPRYPASCVHGP